MTFKKSFILGYNYSLNDVKVFACLLVLICYPHEKAKSVASHFSLPSGRPGLGGCDVTGRILNSKKKGHTVDLSIMLKCDIHV